MQRIAQFEKVSWKQFQQDWINTFGEGNKIHIKDIRSIYDKIQLPKRATSGSAGYDFFSPSSFTLQPNFTENIPTGIRVKIDEGWVLKCYPRSGLGFKYRLQLNNTVGVIDSDYYYSDNVGHIFLKVTNCTNEGKTIKINSGDRFAQGIFVQYGITYDDDTDAVRNGGFGSTDHE